VCDCGNVSIVASWNLVSGGTVSCGCYLKEISLKHSLTHGQNRKGNTSKEYRAWQAMKARCDNEKDPCYPDYGGRGIVVCERWLNSFENFFADMGKKPSVNHSLDRFPDMNGNYCPENCRWATQLQQAGNKRNNSWLEHNGKRMIQADWARYFSMDTRNFHAMLKRNPFEKVYNKLNQKLKQ
jgi:hypothetical protein